MNNIQPYAKLCIIECNIIEYRYLHKSHLNCLNMQQDSEAVAFHYSHSLAAAAALNRL